MRAEAFGWVPVMAALLVLISSCSDGRETAETASGGSSGSAVFGGSAGTSENDSPGGEGGGAAIAGSNAGPTTGGRCAAAPPFVEARIDNFEDGNTQPVSEPSRTGFWQLAQNEAQPPASFVIEEGGADGTDFAGHYSSAEYTENGVSLGLGMRFEGLSCPYDATGSVGIGLYTKGSGRIRLRVSTEAIFSTEWGGTCDEQLESCWDAHQKLIPLSEEFTYREIRWTDLSQEGWGKAFPFDPSAIMNLLFVPGTEGEGVEFFVDEIRFLTAETAGGD